MLALKFPITRDRSSAGLSLVHSGATARDLRASHAMYDFLTPNMLRISCTRGVEVQRERRPAHVGGNRCVQSAAKWHCRNTVRTLSFETPRVDVPD
jgi:hypothetical protein